MGYNQNHWTYSAIYCLMRNANCKGCYYAQNKYETLKCQMYRSVISLLCELGKPTKELYDSLNSDYDLKSKGGNDVFSISVEQI